jgi:plasmid maintenance system antidote protein VapI
VHGKRAVSAETDLRLARYFGLHEGFFLGLQVAFDLMEEKRRLGKRLDEISPRAA